LTKEQLGEIRERNERFKTYCGNIADAIAVPSRLLQGPVLSDDVSMLLEAIEALKESSQRWINLHEMHVEEVQRLSKLCDEWKAKAETAEAWANEYKAAHIVGLPYAHLELERDAWKAKAEAYEKVIKGDCSYCVNGIKLGVWKEACKHRPERKGECEYWQFDAERFAGKEADNGY